MTENPDRDLSFVLVTVIGWLVKMVQASQHVSRPAAEVLAWALHRRLDPLVRPVLRRWFEEGADEAEEVTVHGGRCRAIRHVRFGSHENPEQHVGTG